MKTPIIDQETHLSEVAHRFVYPPTPDVAGAVRERLEAGKSRPVPVRVRWAAAAAALAILLAVLFAVPAARAEILRFFQIGVVRILPSTPTSTAEVPRPEAIVTATPRAASTFVPALLSLVGETTLEEAQQKVDFPIRLPTYPLDLGQPERIFVQPNGPMVILVWLEPGQPDKVRMSLHEIAPGAITITKVEPQVVEETQVNGQYAVWAEGPYLVQVAGGGYDERRLVEGHTLIWVEGEITYRLETDLPLEEAVRIAESLR